jgi:hypothetical protein
LTLVPFSKNKRPLDSCLAATTTSAGLQGPRHASRSSWHIKEGTKVLQVQGIVSSPHQEAIPALHCSHTHPCHSSLSRRSHGVQVSVNGGSNFRDLLRLPFKLL